MLFPCLGEAQNENRIKISYNEMMICADTIYFGVIDSIVTLQPNTDYKIQRNFLLRSNVYYEDRPHKKQQVEARMLRYYKLWQNAYICDNDKQEVVSAQHYFKQFEGKVIRNIQFKSIDMFEGRINDTTKMSITNLGQYLNKIHVSTHNYVLRNNLRFKENERLQSMEMAENERLLRQLDYIEDARIIVTQQNLLADSIDITIITKDMFPYGINTKIADIDQYSIAPYTKNFLGLGHYIEVGLHYNVSEKPPMGYSYQYNAANIAGSFVDLGINRINNYEKNNTNYLIERQFVTTDMKFGGAISYDDINETLEHRYNINDTLYKTPYHKHLFEAWLGRTFILSPSGNRPNFSIAADFTNEIFLNRPYVSADSNQVFHNNQMLLGALMLQKVSFFKTQKLQGFGVTEDVPIGYSIKLTGGYNWGEFINRKYIGLKYSTVIVRPRKGLLHLYTKLGSYFYEQDYEDAFIKLGSAYFSPIIKAGEGTMRHILTLDCSLLYNRKYDNWIDINDDIPKSLQKNIEGCSVMTVRYEPTFHIPYKLIGFRFSFTPFSNIGIVSDQCYFKGNTDFYSVFGLTTRIKNESLTIPTFGIDVKYYPVYSEKRNQILVSAYFRDTWLFEELFSPKPKINKPL